MWLGINEIETRLGTKSIRYVQTLWDAHLHLIKHANDGNIKIAVINYEMEDGSPDRARSAPDVWAGPKWKKEVKSDIKDIHDRSIMSTD